MDKCITTDGHEKNGTPHTTQIVYNYEFIDDFCEEKLSALGSFLLKKVFRYKSQNQEGDIPLTIINDQTESGDPNLVMLTTFPRTQTTQYDVKNWGPKGYDKDNHTMSLMVIVTKCY